MGKKNAISSVVLESFKGKASKTKTQKLFMARRPGKASSAQGNAPYRRGFAAGGASRTEGRTGLAADLSAAGQVSAEYLGITAFFLVLAGIFFAYAFSTFGESKNLALSQDTVSRIAGNANLVASMGNGSQVYFDVEFPDSSQSIAMYNKFIALTYSSPSGNATAYTYSKANITPLSMSVTGGRRTMSATFADGNVVIG